MGGSPYQSVTTSYDYDAPLSEAGDPTDSKFAHIRTAIEVITGKAVAGPIPPATKKSAYGPVRLQFFGFVTDMLDVLCTTENRISTLYPLSYEQIHFPYGYVLYEAKLTVAGTNLSIPEPHDRGYVTLDRDSVGTLIRDHVTSLKVNAKPGQTLRILIENMGRKCNGENDYKGIISNVTIDGNLVTGWTIYPLDLESVSKSFQLKVISSKTLIFQL